MHRRTVMSCFSLLLPLCFFFFFFFFSVTNAKPVVKASSSPSNGLVTVELWCVAKNNAEDSALQSALDWACGPGGADCTPIQQGGPCYDPTDIQNMASFAFNDYFLKNGLSDDSCFFDNTAALTSLNPSHNKCKFPSSFSVANGTNNSSSNVTTGPASADSSGCSRVRFATMVWSLITLLFFFTIPRVI